MRGIDWKTPLATLILCLLLVPQFQNRTHAVNQRIEAAQKRLLLSKDLISRRDDYILMRKELEVRGESLWTGGEAGDLLSELQAISKEQNLPIMNMRNATAKSAEGEDLIAVELELQGSMAAVGGFIYRALRLPGIVTLEKLSLSEGHDAGGVQAQFLISRKTIGPKSGNLVT